MLPAPTLTELAAFSGRPEGSFTAFSAQALEQAALMFSVLTKLKEYPTDLDQLKLAKFAILEMAYKLLLEQPYVAIKSGPFQSETIGSYSYSKATATAVKASSGNRTGLFWWDLAIDELSAAGTSLLSHGSIFIEHEGLTQNDDGTYSLRDPHQDADIPPYIRIS